jgi:16S rRNA (uracil1498-N3)-methyltransferase
VRIFVSPLRAGEATITGDEHHYLSRVRRARVGDAIELVDGAGLRAMAVIAAIGDAATTLTVGAPAAEVAAGPRVRVLVPLIKGDRMDYCLEKLVEVGADEIVVWPAARAVVVLDPAKRDGRLAKFRALVQAAARQSGRAAVPTVAIAETLAAALAAVPASAAGSSRFVLDPAAGTADVAFGADDVTLVSGPEGGFAPAERDSFAAAEFAPLGLGPRILRAETAPVVGVALVRAATRS